MPRKPRTLRTTCSVCGAPRKENSRHALCETHQREAESRNAQRWRERHPEKLRAIRDAENAARKRERKSRVVKVKPVRVAAPKPKPVVVRPYVPDVQVVIGPEAIERVRPVDVRGHKVTRLAPVHGWGR
jgi:hypothetical protein